MKISIVMTYFDRQWQLSRTLKSIKSTHNDFDVVVVDDNSPDDIIVPSVPFEVNTIKLMHRNWTNPEPVYNTGIDYAIRHGADVIIIQNAECYHVGDIIERASRITDDKYISFGCFSINQIQTFDDHDIHQLIRSNNFGASHDGQNAWYNHPVHRPVGYDFCSAMTTENMIRLNGFDERLSAGMAYGDDYLIRRIRMLGLDVEITADPFVVHQWHYNGNGVPANKSELVERNRKLFYELTARNEPRAEHIHTNDFKRIVDQPVVG